MTKAEQTRLTAWRFKVLQAAGASPRAVARTCRHFGISRQAFYKWKTRYETHGAAALCDLSPGLTLVQDSDYLLVCEIDSVASASSFGSGAESHYGWINFRGAGQPDYCRSFSGVRQTRITVAPLAVSTAPTIVSTTATRVVPTTGAAVTVVSKRTGRSHKRPNHNSATPAMTPATDHKIAFMAAALKSSGRLAPRAVRIQISRLLEMMSLPTTENTPTPPTRSAIAPSTLISSA